MKILSLGVVIVLAVNLSGCSHFIIHEEDSIPLVTVTAEEASTPVVTASGLLPDRGVRKRIVVWGNHPGIVGAMIEDFQTQGQTVLERSRIEALLLEQQVRLTYSPDSDTDVLRVGKLVGADEIVFAEAPSEVTSSAHFYKGRGNARTSTTYHLVSLRGVSVETGEIQWTSTARFPGGVGQPDSGLVVLTKAALARARCLVSQGARWSNRLGCVVGE